MMCVVDWTEKLGIRSVNPHVSLRGAASLDSKIPQSFYFYSFTLLIMHRETFIINPSTYHFKLVLTGL